MDNAVVNEDRKRLAFAALGKLLAESVPGASFSPALDEEDIFRLTIPEGAELADYQRRSLAGLVDHAESCIKDGNAYLFFL